MARALLAWYDRSARALPWRRQRSPYGALVSELMLQQTVASVVAPRFIEFLRRFPDFASLARAPESEVLAAWSGLGYYSRAGRLHEAARVVVERYGGTLPASVDELKRLPGVGTYTAAAIAAIAYDVPAFALDGNAARVVARLTNEQGRIDRAAVRTRLQRSGDTLVPDSRAGDFVQAVMDLGATICVPRTPACDRCVLRRWCLAALAGTVASIPRVAPRPKRRVVRVACARVLRGGHVLLVPSPRGELLAGTWVLPSAPVESSGRAAAASARRAAKRVGITAARITRAGSVRHLLTHRELLAEVFDVVPAPRGETVGPGVWADPADAESMSGLAVASFTRKLLAAPRATRQHSRRKCDNWGECEDN